MADTTIDLDQVFADVIAAEREAEPLLLDEPTQSALAGDDLAEEKACPADSDDARLADHDTAKMAATSAAGLVTASHLDGVPLFFARGVPKRPQSFPIEPGFRDQLVKVIRTVRFRVPESYGELKEITSAGAFVDKPGMHGLGRAFDNDAWTFQHVDIRPFDHHHASGSLAKRRRYWALAALMRSHSAFVLHGLFNAAHEDHIHFDNGGPTPFLTSSEATVKLVQAICKHIFGANLATDGDYGPQSRAAVAAAMTKLELGGDVQADESEFRRFLLRSGRLGFHLAPA